MEILGNQRDVRKSHNTSGSLLGLMSDIERVIEWLPTPTQGGGGMEGGESEDTLQGQLQLQLEGSSRRYRRRSDAENLRFLNNLSEFTSGQKEPIYEPEHPP